MLMDAVVGTTVITDGVKQVECASTMGILATMDADMDMLLQGLVADMVMAKSITMVRAAAKSMATTVVLVAAKSTVTMVVLAGKAIPITVTREAAKAMATEAMVLQAHVVAMGTTTHAAQEAAAKSHLSS